MRDPNAGRYSRLFLPEFRIAERVLQPDGGALAWSRNDYEAFFYLSERACIVFYPFTAHNGAQYLRVRDRASADRRHARDLMIRLDLGAGLNPTFTQSATGNAYSAARQTLLSQNKIAPGWAARGIYP